MGDTASPEYSRAGNFSINADGLLVNGDGKNVLGFPGTTTSLGALDVKNIQASGAATTTVGLLVT